jgi:hypothetical protein
MRGESIQLEGLFLGSLYDRRSIAELGGVKLPVPRDPIWSSGVVRFDNAVLLFVTLEKTDYDYQDSFDGRSFWWQSQTKQTQTSPAIRDILDGKAVRLFARVAAKEKGKAAPFVYCGVLTAPVMQGERPVTALFDSPEYLDAAIDPIARIYNWRPSSLPRTGETRRSEIVQRTGGKGRQLDPVKRKLLEEFSMAHATNHYMALGYVVRDTSKGMPYDLECTRGEEVRRVEVKGTAMGGGQVLVTIGEVRAARLGGVMTDLYVLHDVGWAIDAAGARPFGGSVRLVEGWDPADSDLVATAFEYRLPSVF